MKEPVHVSELVKEVVKKLKETARAKHSGRGNNDG